MRTPFHIAAGALVLAPILFLQPRGDPVATAFLDNTRKVLEEITLAAHVMPDSQFWFKPGDNNRAFGEIVQELPDRTDYLCSRISGTKSPERESAYKDDAKAYAEGRLRAAISFCMTALTSVRDVTLGDSIVIDFRYPGTVIGPPGKKTVAASMLLAAQFWSAEHRQLSDYLRLNGKAPPHNCGKTEPEDLDCGTGVNVCRVTTRSTGPSVITLSDAPYTVTSDGRGPYRPRTANIDVAVAGSALVVVLGPRRRVADFRTFRVDLSRPVVGDIGVPRGTIVATGEVAAQWMTTPDNRMHSMLDIPIGTTVKAQQIDVEMHTDSTPLTIQVGPQPEGHCFTDKPAIFGTGTSQGTITRRDSTTFEVDLPVGSVGRLFDIRYGYANAVNLGLYNVSLHMIAKRPD